MASCCRAATGALLTTGTFSLYQPWSSYLTPALLHAHSDTVYSVGCVAAQLRHGRAGTVAGIKLWVHIPIGRLIEQAPAARGPALGLSSAGPEHAAEHSCCKELGHARAGPCTAPTTAACLYSQARTGAAPACATYVSRFSRRSSNNNSNNFVLPRASKDKSESGRQGDLQLQVDAPPQKSRSQQTPALKKSCRDAEHCEAHGEQDARPPVLLNLQTTPGRQPLDCFLPGCGAARSCQSSACRCPAYGVDLAPRSSVCGPPVWCVPNRPVQSYSAHDTLSLEYLGVCRPVAGSGGQRQREGGHPLAGEHPGQQGRPQRRQRVRIHAGRSGALHALAVGKASAACLLTD